MGYRFRVGPYRFCSNGNPTTLSIPLCSYLHIILSDADTHIKSWRPQLLDQTRCFSARNGFVFLQMQRRDGHDASIMQNWWSVLWLSGTCFWWRLDAWNSKMERPEWMSYTNMSSTSPFGSASRFANIGS